MKNRVVVAVLFSLVCVPASAAGGAAPDRRDPFRSPLVDAGAERSVVCGNSPLGCVNLEHIKLRAVVVETVTPRAMFEDAQGRGYSVRIGDIVAEGRVRSIDRDGVTIERTFHNALGGVFKDVVRVALHD
jgi:hypothetical protein